MTNKLNLALLGNPNSGKTTLFNALTGSNQHIGNFPGVTVERKSGLLKANHSVTIQDLPGIYSLSPYSSEEIVTRNYLLQGHPDKLLDVIDATNLERNLYLTLQLMETGLPTILILNMMDRLKKDKHRSINLKKLSYILQLPVVGISALKHKGIDKLNQAITQDTQSYHFPEYDSRLESSLKMIGEQIKDLVPNNLLRWYEIKIFEQDEEVLKSVSLNEQQNKIIKDTIKTAELIFDDSSDSIIVNARYDFIAKVINMCVIDNNDFTLSISDKIDAIVTNRWLALPIFLLVMWVVYYLSIQTVGTYCTNWINDQLFGRIVPNFIMHYLAIWNVAAWMKHLIVDGIINGVGSVLGFLPQIIMLFLCLGILEDCGYMSRIAFVMDRIFHKFNLSGKSFIPMLISTGCGVPGIMSTRTIESEKDRKMTIMLTTFMPCSAKLTIISLISGTFFPKNTWVAPSAYFLSIMAVVGSGIFLKKTKIFSGSPAPFVMELPSYHWPKLDNTLRGVWDRSRAFVVKAGTIIFLSCIGIWFLSSFNFKLQMVSQNESILRYLGNIIAPIFKPLGIGDWHATVGILSGLIAKENCVSALHVTFNAGSNATFIHILRHFYPAMAGYAFLSFNLLCAPCFASISTMYHEFGSAKWAWYAISYQTLLAYIVSIIIYQTSCIFNKTATITGVILDAIALSLIIYALFIKKEKILENEKGEEKLCLPS